MVLWVNQSWSNMGYTESQTTAISNGLPILVATRNVVHNQSILEETSPEYSLEGLMLKLKLRYFGHLMWRIDSFEKTLMLGMIWRQEEKGTTENEMVGWHHWLNGHEFASAPGIGDGQGSLACCSPWGCKELDKTERLNWTEPTSIRIGSLTQGLQSLTVSWAVIVLRKSPNKTETHHFHIVCFYFSWCVLSFVGAEYTPGHGIARSCGVCMCSQSAQSLQSCPTLCDPMDCSPLDSSVHATLQARILESVALLQGIFPTQGLKQFLPCLLHWQADSWPLSHPGSPGHMVAACWIFWRTIRLFAKVTAPFFISISLLCGFYLWILICPSRALCGCWCLFTLLSLAGHFSEICFLTGCSVRECSLL